MISKTNLKVMVHDTDFYGRNAISSYLAWDRRTRVVHLAESIGEIPHWLAEHTEAEWPDVILLDTFSSPTADHLRGLIRQLHEAIQDLLIIVLDRSVRLDYALAALDTVAGAYFLRNDVGLQIAWAIVWAQRPEFAISQSVLEKLSEEADERLQNAVVLPQRRRYPELTDRIREAIQLCVVEGMSADLAADEMGVSPHTIRSYVKEGYRILESYDIGVEYPPEMSAQERAFMRFTALEEDDYQDNDGPLSPTKED